MSWKSQAGDAGLGDPDAADGSRAGVRERTKEASAKYRRRRLGPQSLRVTVGFPERFEGLAHGMREKELDDRLTRVELPARAPDDELRSILWAAGPRVSAANDRVEHDARAADARSVGGSRDAGTVVRRDRCERGNL